jgi:hypothetical protein
MGPDVSFVITYIPPFLSNITSFKKPCLEVFIIELSMMVVMVPCFVIFSKDLASGLFICKQYTLSDESTCLMTRFKRAVDSLYNGVGVMGPVTFEERIYDIRPPGNILIYKDSPFAFVLEVTLLNIFPAASF